MSGKSLKKNDIMQKYNENSNKYERLGQLITQELKTLLENEEIPVMDIDYRVKEFDSLWDKIERKKIQDPFEEIEDICGVRIVCPHKTYLNIISKLIRNEFDILKFEDKSDLLEPDRFGYLSLHFIVNIDDWLSTPSNRDLWGLKAEIQIRTILMHAWADISHKLSYKHEEEVPDHLKRKLNRLIALFEIADDQFDSLVKEIDEYQVYLIKEAEKSGRFDVNQDLNLDSLQAFMDVYFEGKKKSIKRTRGLLETIQLFNRKIGRIIGDEISIKTLVEDYEKSKDHLNPESYDRDDMNEKDKFDTFTQSELTSRVLWENHRKWGDFIIDEM